MESNWNDNRSSYTKRAVISLIFGILSIAIHHLIGLVLGIFAVVLANDYLRLAQNSGTPIDKRASVGRILGIIGIVISSASVIWTLFKISGFITALLSSISSGSLGLFEEYFKHLGESLRGGFISSVRFFLH